MNEKSKIYIVFGVVVALVVGVIGFNISVAKKSEKIYNDFLTKFESKEEKIVFIGREGCSWCQLFRPIFDYYTEKYDFSYTYIDTGDLVEKDFNKLIDKIEVKEDKFGTPLVAFVKDGKVTEIIDGYVDESKLLNILKEHELADTDEKDSLNYLDFESLKKTIKSKEKSLIVIGQTYCSFCIKFKPILMNVADTKNVKIYYMNYDAVEEQTELKEYLSNFEEFSNFGTPLTIITENGKILDSLNGYRTENEFVKFLTDNNLLGEEEK